MNNEKRFFEGLFAAANPDWKTNPTPGIALGPLASYETFIYVVDVRTGWTAAGATSQKAFANIKVSFEKTLAQPGASLRALTGLAANQTAEAASMNAAVDSPEALECVSTVGCALVTTRTFDLVKEATGGLAGHWAYLVYSTPQGEFLGRPAYASDPHGCLMSVDSLRDLIVQTVWHDTCKAGTAVGRQLADCGGAILNSVLEEQVAAMQKTMFPEASDRPEA